LAPRRSSTLPPPSFLQASWWHCACLLLLHFLHLLGLLVALGSWPWVQGCAQQQQQQQQQARVQG
jgi:hypothetical protein